MKPVSADELEVSLFGPGYGEAVAVHLGAGQWVLADSCREPSGRPAALAYFEKIGVNPATAVRLVVASHWHDDHIRGLADVVRACRAARFVCASALTRKEFTTLVTRYEQRNRIAAGSGVAEMFEVLNHLEQSGRRPFFALPNRLILRCEEAQAVARGSCEVTCLSPADSQLANFLVEIASLMPQHADTKRRATPGRSNHLAIALWIVAGSEAILLGSDLEETSDPNTGWSVIVESKERPKGAAIVFKIPHHGSETAHSDSVWDNMVKRGAYAVLTPFRRGDVSLPTPGDIQRIADRSGAAYITALAERQSSVSRPPAVQKTIKETVGKLRFVEADFGHVCLRKRFGEGHQWHASLGGAARRLK